MLSLGGGALYDTSTHQKLNTKSLMEAKLIAVDDIMPQVLWMTRSTQPYVHTYIFCPYVISTLYRSLANVINFQKILFLCTLLTTLHLREMD
jgi:hypothetical protein